MTMAINRKVLIVLILALVFSWVGNFMYYSKQSIDRPIILKHYMDNLVYPKQPVTFELYYFTNRNKKTEIDSIELSNEMPLLANIRNEEMYGYNHIVLNRARVEIDPSYYDSITQKEDLKLDEISVRFRDGQVQRVNVGEIILRNKREPYRETALDMVESGSSNNNTGYNLFRIKGPITVESIEYSFKNRLENALRVSLSSSTKPWIEPNSQMEEVHPRNIGVDQNALLDTIHFPIHLEKENTLRVAYQFRFDDSNDFGRYAFYKIYSRIQFVEQNGQQEEMEVEMHYIPEFQKKDILKYIAERREE